MFKTGQIAVSMMISLSLSAAAVAQTPGAIQSGRNTGSMPGTMPHAGGAGATKAGALNANDQKFVNEAAQTNLKEIKLGQLAQQKAQSAEVKSFAEHMVQDHTSSQNSLRTVAERLGAQLPTDVDQPAQQIYNRLEKLSGHQFDVQYMNAMVQDHTKTANTMRHEESRLKNDELKAWNSNTLKTVEEHVKLAQSTEKSVARMAAGAHGEGSKRSGGASTHY